MKTTSHEIDAEDLAACLAFAIRGYPMTQQVEISAAFACGVQTVTGQTDKQRDLFLQTVGHWCMAARKSLDKVEAILQPTDNERVH